MSEYEEDLKIDFAELDICWRDQATNFMKWSQEWVNAVTVRDRKKEEVEVVKAELDGEYRKTLLKKDGKKPTEATVSAAIQTDERYQKIQNDFIDSIEKMNTFACLKTAFEHRKMALEGSTRLWLGGYFSEPRIPIEIKEKFEENSNYKEEQTKILNENKRLQKRKVNPIKKK